MLVIAASGENNAAVALRSATDVISGNPAAMQLRYLQVGTGRNIRVGRNRKVEFGSWKLEVERWIAGLKDQLVTIMSHQFPYIPIRNPPYPKDSLVLSGSVQTHKDHKKVLICRQKKHHGYLYKFKMVD